MKKPVWAVSGLLLLLAAVSYYHQFESGSRLDASIAAGNGRIEATEIDIATKLAGRIRAIHVREGDFVIPGEPLAVMDTAVLDARLAEARAKIQQASNAIDTALAIVSQRESEKVSAQAVVRQRQAELRSARKRYDRSDELVRRNSMSRQQLDDDLAAYQSSQAALAAAEAQVQSAQASIYAARSQVIEARSSLQAARATAQRLQADIDDSTLQVDRVARVQYRVAEPGEVLPAGGKILNLVDLQDVYMTFFLPERQAGRVAIGAETRLVLDAIPQYVIPARVSYVAAVAQFTPKTVETLEEREKLMFRVKANIPQSLLQQHLEQVKTGLPGMAYVKLDAAAPWPAFLELQLPPAE